MTTKGVGVMGDGGIVDIIITFDWLVCAAPCG